MNARLEVARLLVDTGRAAEGNALLTDLLRQSSASGLGAHSVRIHELRHEARLLLGDDEGAALDRRAADTLKQSGH